MIVCDHCHKNLASSHANYGKAGLHGARGSADGISVEVCLCRECVQKLKKLLSDLLGGFKVPLRAKQL